MIAEHVKNKLLTADWVLVNSSAGKGSQASREALVTAWHHNRRLLKQYAHTERAIGHRFKMSLSMVEVAAGVESGECPTAVPDWNM